MKARAFDWLAAGAVVAAWLLAARAIATLPPQIPTHFSTSGDPDETGPSWSLLILPAIMVVFFAALRGAQAIPPNLVNYPVKITDANRLAVYALGRDMLRAINALTLLGLLSVEWATIDAAERGSLGPLFAPAIALPVAAVAGVIIRYVWKMRTV